MSEYDDKLKKLDKLKKSTEIARKTEIVRILERYCGKIKDLKAFEEFLKNKNNSDFIRLCVNGMANHSVKTEP